MRELYLTGYYKTSSFLCNFWYKKIQICCVSKTMTEVVYKEVSWSILSSFLSLYTFFSSLFLLFLYAFLCLQIIYTIIFFSYSPSYFSAPLLILFYCSILLFISIHSFLESSDHIYCRPHHTWELMILKL